LPFINRDAPQLPTVTGGKIKAAGLLDHEQNRLLPLEPPAVAYNERLTLVSVAIESFKAFGARTAKTKAVPALRLPGFMARMKCSYYAEQSALEEVHFDS
jgi:hypothetical protein